MQVTGKEIIDFIQENKLEDAVWTNSENTDNTMECCIEVDEKVWVTYYINKYVKFFIEYENDNVRTGFDDYELKTITTEEALKLRGLAE